MDVSTVGNFFAQYTLSFSDEDLVGASSLSDLVLTLSSTVESDWRRGDFNGNDTLDAGDIDRLVTDWNGNTRFDTADFVIAFEDGGYEKGPKQNAAIVPEPEAVAMLLAATWLLLLPQEGNRTTRRLPS